MRLGINKSSLMSSYMLGVFIMWILYVPSTLIAQTPTQASSQADSLRQAIAAAKHDTTRINVMNALAHYFLNINRDSTNIYAQRAKKMAESSNYSKGIAQSSYIIGQNLFFKSSYYESLSYMRNALQLYEKLSNYSDISETLHFIGLSYRNLRQYDKALEHLYKALLVIEEHKTNKEDLAGIFNSLANVYRNLEKYDDALVWYVKSLQINEGLGNTKGVITALGNIGRLYQTINNNSVALEYHLKALQKSRDYGDKNYLIYSLSELGTTYNRVAKYSQARDYLFQALQLLGKDINADLPEILNNIGISYRGQQKLDSAFAYSLRALNISDSLRLPFYTNLALEELSTIAELQGHHKEALAYHKRYTAIKDSLTKLSNYAQATELKEAYEAEKREQQIAFLSKDKELLIKDKALQESELIRAGAEQKAQAQSILLLNNEKQVRELTVSRQEAELTAAHARDEQNKQALALANTEQEVQRAELKRRNVIAVSLVGFLILTAIAAVWLWWLNRQKLRANRKILKQQQILEEQAVEIDAANKELLATNTELDEANRMKTQLLSMAAHDLKNPLGVILGYSDIILFDTPKGSDTEKYVQEMQSTAYRMNNLIGDLLDSAAMEMGNITLELDEFDFPALVSAIADRYQHSAAQKDQHFQLDIGEEISMLGDVRRLEQVFDNLISNAVKYSPFGKTIFLRVRKHQANARLEVRDEGPGMSEEDRQKLFGFFQRLSAQPTGGESSNGVGLAIVKKIVDLHKGSIWAESELGKGTTFIVELPISR